VAAPFGWEEPSFLPAQSPAEEAFMKKWGANPRQMIAQGNYIWSIWYHVTDPAWMWVVHGLVLCSILLFTIGFATRVTAVLTWLGVLSYIHRSQVSLFGMDAMMSLLLLYLMIGPSGAALSIDRLLARWRAVRAAQKAHLPVPPPEAPAPSISANFALRLIQIHFCFIYAMAGVSKLQGGMWWTGTAVWWTMANYEFCPWDNFLYAAALRGLAKHRWLWELTMTFGTFYTLVFEISFPFLVWNRSGRWLMVAGAVLLHFSIALCMGLVTFSMLMLTGVMSFISADSVRRLLSNFTGPRSRSPGSAADGYP
jgi:hypothetical protein